MASSLSLALVRFSLFYFRFSLFELSAFRPLTIHHGEATFAPGGTYGARYPISGSTTHTFLFG